MTAFDDDRKESQREGLLLLAFTVLIVGILTFFGHQGRVEQRNRDEMKADCILRCPDVPSCRGL